MLPLIATLVIVIAVLLAAVSRRPGSFRIQRSITIQAAPETVFPLINDFRSWGAWSPWDKIDPALKRTFSGSAAGVGAAYAWEGNNKVGSGSMEILASTAPSQIRIKLDFLKPFEAHHTAEFTLVPSSGGTEVTWAMLGSSPFMMKLMGIFIDMDKVIGKDFDKGLATMKAVAERG